MPTYVYACKGCDHRFEQYQSFTDESLSECPECQGNLRKVFNSVGVVFKGSGFYRNDARGGSKASSTLVSSDSASTPASQSSPAHSSEPTSSSNSGNSAAPEGSHAKPAATTSKPSSEKPAQAATVSSTA